MSNTPGVNPLTPDLEDIRHSDDPAFDDKNEPATAEDDETDEEAAARIQRQTLDLA